METLSSKVLESLMIEDNITLENIFSSNNVSDSEVRNSYYYKLPDRELATMLVDLITQNFLIKLASKDDPQVEKMIMFLRTASVYYFEYNISGYPVVVTKQNRSTKEATFTIYAYIPKTNKYAKATGYTKTELVRKLILNNKVANEALSAD